MREPGAFGIARGRGFDTGRERADRVGQLDLDATLPRGIEPLLQRGAAALRRECTVIGEQRGIGQHVGMEASHQLGAQIVEVLHQLHVRAQAEFGQQIERRSAQQLREPGVEGAHLDRAAAGQHLLVQADQCLRLQLRGTAVDATQHQLLDRAIVIESREALQPLGQARAHLAGGLARESDRQDVLRRSTVEQRTHDARHQHPGLAGTGTGFDDDGTARVAGGGVERLAADAAAIQAVGRCSHVATSPQWSRRHRPRASQ